MSGPLPMATGEATAYTAIVRAALDLSIAYARTGGQFGMTEDDPAQVRAANAFLEGEFKRWSSLDVEFDQ